MESSIRPRATVPAENGTTQARTAPAALPARDRRFSPAPSRPAFSDSDEFMVESFVTGFCNCPPDYLDVFVDSWMESHHKGQPLLFAAYVAIDIVKRLNRVKTTETGGTDALLR